MAPPDGHQHIGVCMFLEILYLLAKGLIASGTISYMEDHLHQSIRMKELADLVFLSTRQYDRIFKEVYGVCPSDYLSELRLNRACQLIASGKYPLGQLWELCGFTDTPFFYRKFKARFGMTPKQYQTKLLSSMHD